MVKMSHGKDSPSFLKWAQHADVDIKSKSNCLKNWDNCGCSCTSIALELQVVLGSPLTQQLFGYHSTEHLVLKVLAISASPWCHDHNLGNWLALMTLQSPIITIAICNFLCQLPSNKRNGKAGQEGHKLLLSHPTLQQLSQTSLRHTSSLYTLLCLEAAITGLVLEPHRPLTHPPLLKSSQFRPCPRVTHQSLVTSPSFGNNHLHACQPTSKLPGTSDFLLVYPLTWLLEAMRVL